MNTSNLIVHNDYAKIVFTGLFKALKNNFHTFKFMDNLEHDL
jgi:hypothetical protein